jgi:hypothetical protein
MGDLENDREGKYVVALGDSLIAVDFQSKNQTFSVKKARVIPK